MGIPSAFLWLSKKYPRIISDVQEEKAIVMADGTEVPVDMTQPNPNGEEFDNLYLDMNGIVHPCTHPEGRPAPADEEEMMLEIFRYTERLVAMVRPRGLLMMAIDGVAPRAKMNQQRMRRFRSAQDALESSIEKMQAQKQLLAKAIEDGTSPILTLDQAVRAAAFDANTITPGTPFMDKLALALRYWSAYKFNTDPGWAKLKVIISDASIPGEGEHKIMDFIRSQRAAPAYNPNTRHVLCGLDADLIMLGLASHEPHFRILREDVFAGEQNGNQAFCSLCHRKGHFAHMCRGPTEAPATSSSSSSSTSALPDQELDERKPFIWLDLAAFREYLAIELSADFPTSVPFDLERAIDDWICLCCFVGNDFLPHLPTLSIRENGILHLMHIWKQQMPKMGGYVTRDGTLDMPRFQQIIEGLAAIEPTLLSGKRQPWRSTPAQLDLDNMVPVRQLEELRAEAQGVAAGTHPKRKVLPPKKQASSHDHPPPPKRAKTEASRVPDAGTLKLYEPGDLSTPVVRPQSYQNMANLTAASRLKARLQQSDAEATVDTDEATVDADEATVDTAGAVGKRKADEFEAEPTEAPAVEPEEDEAEDEAEEAEEDEEEDGDEPGNKYTRRSVHCVGKFVNTGLAYANNIDAYIHMYYKTKFQVEGDRVEETRDKVAKAYAEGIAWVLQYYFQGCPSWEWYYPYHYAPFARDFHVADTEFTFARGSISRPFEQLMSVLPPASCQAIPEVFHDLMLDPKSAIADFYPRRFTIDMNGEKHAWKGIAQLPFIDMGRLRAAMASKWEHLSDEDKRRNEVGREVLIFSDQHEDLYGDVSLHFYGKKKKKLRQTDGEDDRKHEHDDRDDDDDDDRFSLDMGHSGGLAGEVERIPDYLPHDELVYPFARKLMDDLPFDRSIRVYYTMPALRTPHKSMLLRGVELPAPKLDVEQSQRFRLEAMARDQNMLQKVLRQQQQQYRQNNQQGGIQYQRQNNQAARLPAPATNQNNQAAQRK